MKKYVKQIPNIITALRVVAACVLLFSKAYSVLFLVTFSICVASDIFDGFFARLLKAETERGAKFDSFADFVFFVFSACVILPAVVFPDWVWIVASVVLLLKGFSVVLSVCGQGIAFLPHNLLNKLSGLCLCAAVYLFGYVKVEPVCIALAVVTGISAIYDIAAAALGRINDYRKKGENL